MQLFCEILNQYLYFFENACPNLTAKYIQALVQLIYDHLPHLSADEGSDAARAYFDNTLAHILYRQRQPDGSC